MLAPIWFEGCKKWKIIPFSKLCKKNAMDNTEFTITVWANHICAFWFKDQFDYSPELELEQYFPEKYLKGMEKLFCIK